MRIGFRWLDDRSHYYADLFDESLFRVPSTNLPIEHEVLKPNGRLYEYARCLLSTNDNQVILNYEAFSEVNTKRGMLLGVVKFTYDPAFDQKISAVFWKEQGTSDFLECATEFVIRPTRQATYDESKELLDTLISEADSLTEEELNNRLPPIGAIPPCKVVTTTAYVRNPYVIVATLRRSDGHCELCKAVAPFRKSKDNEPYLEVHHVLPLSKGGSEDLENAIALCPNCHRERHFGSEA